MSYFRRFCLPGIFGKPQSRTRSTFRFAPRQRSLRLETLENRYALSTLTATDLSTCPSVSNETPIVETTASYESSGELAPDEESFVGPLEADTYFQSVGVPEPEASAGVQEGENGTAPILETFRVTRDGMYWILSGKVTDDYDPSNCRVYFQGAITGSTPVFSDGTFMHWTLYSTAQSGTVTAVAIDAQGNESNMMYAVLTSGTY